MYPHTIKLDKLLAQLLSSVKPDVIIVDSYATLASVVMSGIPFITVRCGNPLKILDDDRAPPYHSGTVAMK